MKPFFIFLISQTILFPLIIGLVRYRTVRVNYHWFFWTIVLGFITEIVSYVLIRHFHAHNAIPTNIFVLSEWALIALQFRAWGLFKKQQGRFLILLCIPILVWLVENVWFSQIDDFSPYFRVLYAFLIVLMAITEINFKITHDNKSLFRNPGFMICLGLILFFVYQMLYEWCYQVSVIGGSTSFTRTISFLFAYINAFTNIIFGLAFLLIPAHKHYSFQKSA